MTLRDSPCLVLYCTYSRFTMMPKTRKDLRAPTSAFDIHLSYDNEERTTDCVQNDRSEVRVALLHNVEEGRFQRDPRMYVP